MLNNEYRSWKLGNWNWSQNRNRSAAL